MPKFPRPINNFSSRNQSRTHNAAVQRAIKQLKQMGQYNPRQNLNATRYLISQIMSEEQKRQNPELTKSLPIDPSTYVESDVNSNDQPKYFITGKPSPFKFVKGKTNPGPNLVLRNNFMATAAAVAGGGKYYKLQKKLK